MDRRRFLAGTAAAAVAAGTGVRVAAQEVDWSVFDLDGREPDENGVIVPEGFRARVVARSQEVVEGTDYEWPIFPDGGATFRRDDGGWVYAANSEVPNGDGGVSALHFDRDGRVADAYRILEGTSLNCAGGKTPWGTWLSCEEWDALTDPEVAAAGVVWECDPMRPGQGVARPALGAFQHEAAAIFQRRREVYLTEDQPDGRFYRFTIAEWPDLSKGLLEVAVVDGQKITWVEIPDPSGQERGPLRHQVPDATVFNGGEGIVATKGEIYFTTKGDNRVWEYMPYSQTIKGIYDFERDDGVLSGVDNITVAPFGDLLVAEDGGNMELVLVSDDGATTPIFRVVGEDHSELTGPAFDPSGRRLYVNSQRGGPLGVGVTFEISGPFPKPAPSVITTAPATTTTVPPELEEQADELADAVSDDDSGGSDDDGGSWVVPVAAGGAALLLGAAAVWRIRSRGGDPEAGEVDPSGGEGGA